MTSDVTIQSLLYVCESEAARLGDTVAAIKVAQPRDLRQLFQRIHQTADVLSGALTKLSHFSAHLPDDDAAGPGTVPPPVSSHLLFAFRRFHMLCANGVDSEGRINTAKNARAIFTDTPDQQSKEALQAQLASNENET
ncbi:hypothetical protein [Pseudoruegeria sp. HB172150]|uniref:hypothetical protein n=1 Tax=Pseudoruegeria sp. HB172150 TaxID=2721164 RepID=UPI0015531267|nr:hypothetical protein [Pseudoruegeria sp. HB172150]